MSQIPTYVTGVPNGTEKVGCCSKTDGSRPGALNKPSLTKATSACRECILPSTWEGPTFASAP